MATHDVEIFNVSADEPSGTDLIVQVVGAASGADASAVSAQQQSNPINVNLTGAAGTALSGAVSNSKRWNPGHYLKVFGAHQAIDQTSYFDSVNSQINNNVEDIPEIIGASVVVAWGGFNTTGSTYDWTHIDGVLDNLASKGKRLILQVEVKCFTGTRGIIAPADIIDDHVQTTGRSSANAGWMTRIDRSAIMDRLISARTAIANRYDDHPNFEMVSESEIPPTWGPGYTLNGQDFGGIPDDWPGNPAYAEQLKRMWLASSIDFVKTNISPLINWLGFQDSSDLTNSLMEECYALRIGIGVPDARATYGVNAFPGPIDGDARSIRDYRGQVPRFMIISATSLSRQSQQELLDILALQNPTHPTWYPGNGNWTWTQIKAAIQANPGMIEIACPTQYSSCEI